MELDIILSAVSLTNAAMNDLQKQMSIAVYFFLGLSIPAVALRCYTRFRVLKSFGIDDVLVVVSLVSIPINTLYHM